MPGSGIGYCREAPDGVIQNIRMESDKISLLDNVWDYDKISHIKAYKYGILSHPAFELLQY